MNTIVFYRDFELLLSGTIPTEHERTASDGIAYRNSEQDDISYYLFERTPHTMRARMAFCSMAARH